MLKKKKESAQRKMAVKTAIIFRTCAVGTSEVPTTNVWGKVMIAPSAMPIRAKAVNDGGPTAMNMPGRMLGEGRPKDMRRPI